MKMSLGTSRSIYGQSPVGAGLGNLRDGQPRHKGKSGCQLYIVEAAAKTATDESMIKKQLGRLGGSGYVMGKLHAVFG